MSQLNHVQSQHVKGLIQRLRNTSLSTMNVGLTREGSLLTFIMNYTDRNMVQFISPFGGESVMVWGGTIVTCDNVNRIASYINTKFGGEFFKKVLLAGDRFANYSVSVQDDILPNVIAYQSLYDNAEKVAKMRAELSQVRALLNVAENPVSSQVGNLIASSTKQRWKTLERKLVADIAEVEAF